MLDDIELKLAKTIISKTASGTYELKDIYLERWALVTPTSFGKKFKASVEAGHINNISLVNNPKSNNHHTYIIKNNSIL